jgi:hypothetical protein
VAELRVELPDVTSVLATPDACAEVERAAGAAACRVADREVLVLGPGVEAPAADPRALVADVSDGWVALVLEGADGADAFARLSELRLPATGWVQGEVARAPAKVLVGAGRLTLLVPAHLAAHVEERIRADAAEVLA